MSFHRIVQRIHPNLLSLNVNRVKELVQKATYDYLNEHLNSHKQNPKLLWRSVPELSGLNSTTQSPSLNDENGNLITDPVITANLFNTHFC